jgi:hypothetical protein
MMVTAAVTIPVLMAEEEAADASYRRYVIEVYPAVALFRKTMPAFF